MVLDATPLVLLLGQSGHLLPPLPFSNTFTGLISIPSISGKSIINWESLRRFSTNPPISSGRSPRTPLRMFDVFSSEIISSASDRLIGATRREVSLKTST